MTGVRDQRGVRGCIFRLWCTRGCGGSSHNSFNYISDVFNARGSGRKCSQSAYRIEAIRVCLKRQYHENILPSGFFHQPIPSEPLDARVKLKPNIKTKDEKNIQFLRRSDRLQAVQYSVS